jgi:hypothetical protein
LAAALQLFDAQQLVLLCSQAQALLRETAAAPPSAAQRLRSLERQAAALGGIHTPNKRS